MRTIILFVTILISTSASGVKKPEMKVPEHLPKNLELKDDLQTFKVVTTHYNGDIFGNLFNKQQICGEYTRGLENGKAKWNKVTMAMSLSTDRNAAFPEGQKIDYMENFTYNPTGNDDMLQANKFETFTEFSDFTKNLIWDMQAIEGFAWAHFQDLKLNEPFSADSFNGKVDLAGNGFFENKDIRLIYTGISERNNETCAIINYRTFNNPLEIKAEGMNMKGRSHYWGTIWVSLEDKQIEHAVLYEDVIMEMQLPGQTQKQVINATREISFKRIL